MLTKVIYTELKWVMLALAVALLLKRIVDGHLFHSGNHVNMSDNFLRLNLFLEILVFFAFSTFVVFGIKGFYERYSHKFANVIMFISGICLAVVIFCLSYQILFQ